jgi:hypothetical protein
VEEAPRGGGLGESGSRSNEDGGRGRAVPFGRRGWERRSLHRPVHCFVGGVTDQGCCGGSLMRRGGAEGKEGDGVDHTASSISATDSVQFTELLTDMNSVPATCSMQ